MASIRGESGEARLCSRLDAEWCRVGTSSAGRAAVPEPADIGREGFEVQLPLVVSVAVAAEMLGISDDLVYELIEREQLPCLRLGRRRLIPRRAIELLVESAMSGFQPEIILSLLACQAPLRGHQRGADRRGGNN
ncbi:MAG TPA: helix-turn-helix domain-containing protein [Acidimicrobiales bacterium]|nr:helix-turn-helix domain-containing protein [Acidimicrobiales bacterium]